MDRSAESLLSGLHEVARSPLEEAFTIPPAIYSSPEIHALEARRIFATDWLCPGLAADIPNPGDYITYTINDQPIFVIRGKDGGIRSFSNVCLHRMMTLVEGSGNCGRITCPYHGWTYDTEGRVIGAGHMGHRDPEFDKKGYRLPELRTEIWHGWIYVTLNQDATPVSKLLAELDPQVARYGLGDYVSVARQDHVWKTNWKLLTENFMEGYHLPVAHKATVGAWMPIDSVGFPEKVYDAFTWQTFTKEENAKYGRAHPNNTRLEGEWRYTTVMPTVFPSHMYVLAPDHMWYLSLRPKGVDEVHVRFGLALAPEVNEALGDTRPQWLAGVIAFFDKVNAEDKFVVEGIAVGSRAPLAKPGPLSWLEREVHDFARYLDRRLNGPATGLIREAAE
ncbi:MAG: Rieske 2Fe-2S domain-containing protein [Rhizobiales bacterium]|nr:Rieske 2Fe-2S domain-containing protein [Hyphomicrobiales bacterium]